MWSALLDWFWPWCPSGMPHRVRMDTVTNVYGSTYCFHRDCIRANFAEVRSREPQTGAE